MEYKGFKSGIIRLNEARSIYYSGQTLSGIINFELAEPLTFAAIKVVYISQAIVKWSERQVEKYSGAERVREIDYFGRDIYFSTEQLLCGGSGPTTLPLGSHSINFSYQIPFNTPSSFKGSKGAVSYRVIAILEHLDLRKDELSTDFEVIAPLDLNNLQEAKKPTVLEFEEVSTCNCFCQDKMIRVKIVLPLSGYCPGQMMQIKIDSKNDSSVEVRKIIFQFTRRERYHSQQPISTYVPPEAILETLVQGPILANTKRSFTCQMRVPDIIAYNLENCQIIDLAYFLKVKIKMSGCADDLQDESELCIGLVPLRETVNESYIHPLSYLLPQSSLPDPNNIADVPKFTMQNTHIPLASSTQSIDRNSQSYQIGFNVPDINIVPPYPVMANTMPLPTNFPMPSAPPLQ
ncbi:unnamed protein product [Leptosia nina]|uniref:Arrestin C-terminal-like domain-containing protein n=1 Tax=Leptosia nina TaxID=320188 RepID=A0AAV1J0W1_9NEOP